MKKFQEIFDAALEQELSLQNLLTKVLILRLENIGITLETNQIIDLKDQIANMPKDKLEITMNFNDSQLAAAGVNSEKELEPLLKKIMQNIPADIIKFHKEADFKETIDEIIKESGDAMFEKLIKATPSMVENAKELYLESNSDIDKIWGRPLDLLLAFIELSIEAVKECVYKDDTYDNDVVNTLARLHGRAIQISKEILILLRNGYADGADARWRTVHEIAVVVHILKEGGDEVVRRYLDHYDIDQYTNAKIYNDHHNDAAIKISDSEMLELSKRKEELVVQYGAPFKTQYGWAADLLDNKKPTFRDLEEFAEMNQMRPYYRSASSNIHSGTSSIYHRLGLDGYEKILAGPSPIGIEEPALSLVVSLNQITIPILTCNPNIDSSVISSALVQFRERTEGAFTSVYNNTNWRDIMD